MPRISQTTLGQQDRHVILLAAAIIFAQLTIDEGQELKAYTVAVRDAAALLSEIERKESEGRSAGV